MSQPAKTSLTVFLISRAVIAGWLLAFGWFAAQWNLPSGPGAAPLPTGISTEGWGSTTFIVPWHRWDTVHYVQVALEGYSRIENTAWPPVYPMLIALVGKLVPNPVLAALLISNLAALAAYGLLYRLVEQDFGPETARRTLVLLTIFPAGFFLTAGYSEAVFLLVGVGSLWAARRGRFWLAAGMAAIAALVRVLGLLLIIPIFWEAAIQFETFRKLKEAGSIPVGMRAALAATPRLLPLTLIPLPYGIFALWIHFGLQAPWPWQTISSGWEMVYSAPWTGVIGNLTALAASGQGAVIPLGTTLLDLAAVVFGAGLLIAGARRLPVSYSLLAGVMLIASLSKVTTGNLLVSAARYLVPLFPLFIIQALTWNKRWLRLVWLGFSLTLQAVLLVVFWLGFWVG